MGSIVFNGLAELQSDLSNAPGGIITVRNGTTIGCTANNAGTIITQNGTFIIANDAGSLDGTGAARVLAGGAVVASQIRQTKLSIEGSQLQPAIVSIRNSIDGGAASRVNELLIAPAGAGFGGAIDLADTGMVIDYVPGSSPLEQIAAMLATGFASGEWTGRGIQSRVSADATGRSALGFAEASNIGSPPVFFGLPIDASSVLIAYTLYGDANLDRIVDIGDFALLGANFNATGSTWSHGDFNYDNLTDIADFALQAADFNQVLPAEVPRGAVPETAGVGLMVLLAGFMNGRRRASCR